MTAQPRPASRLPRRLGRTILLSTAVGLTLTACGSGSSPLNQPGDVERHVMVHADEWHASVTIRRSDGVSVTGLPAPRPEAWHQLKQAWLDLGLPVPAVDDGEFRLTLTNHTLTRRLAGTPLSAYLNCGSSVSGANADIHRVRLTVRSLVETVGDDTSVLHTRVDATATPTAGTSTASTECSSRGVLESRLAAQLLTRIAEAESD